MSDNDEKKLFSFGDSDNQHETGNVDCPACWSSSMNYCKCGGLVHTEFGDENYDGDYWLYFRCDKCGSTEESDLTQPPHDNTGQKGETE